jgi:hypothetical protein
MKINPYPKERPWANDPNEGNVPDPEHKAWDEGFLFALRAYAWWKNGVQYVGCGVQTLEEAIKELNEEE